MPVETILPAKIKATILIENSWGMPIVRHIWLYSYEMRKEKYDYKESLVAFFTYKGKRKQIGLKFEQAVIAKGWQEIKGAMNNTDNVEFECFDDTHFDTLEKQLVNIIIKG